ncbi:MAG: RtcB family protein, partial [Acidobacteria bacterium]|nr:RtcB family protein [Acidobacteriota bacterium]
MQVVIEGTEVLTGPGIVIEDAALAQLRQVAGLPGCVRAVGLPDLHPGMHGPVGAAFAFDGVVRPALVGSDAGCGVRLTAVRRSRFAGDALERRLREEMDGAPYSTDVARKAFEALLAGGIRGLASVDALPPALRILAAAEPEEPPVSRPGWLEDDLIHALGTIGGGNHFAEISEVQGVVDTEAGFARRGVAILVHSGSRGLGKALGDRWRGEVLEVGDPRTAEYLAELEVACRFARANRFVLMSRLATALGAARESSLGASVDV